MWPIALSSQQLVRPTGWIDAAQNASIIPAGARTARKAKPGDFLFSGDLLLTRNGPVTLTYCLPDANASGYLYTITGIASITIRSNLAPEMNWATRRSEVRPCLIPELEQWPDVVTTLGIPDRLKPEAFSVGALASRIRELPPQPRAAIEPLLSESIDEPRARLALGVLLERAGLLEDAAFQYAMLARKWDQVRLLKAVARLVELPSARILTEPPAAVKREGPGRTYALVVGISHYQQSPLIRDLQFADRDARRFVDYLQTPRGNNPIIKVLIDSEATVGAIRVNFMDIKSRAGRNDTVVLFIASHGDMLPEQLKYDPKNPRPNPIPSVITFKAYPEDLAINSFPMEEIQDWMLGRSTPFGASMVFLDVCHSGHVAQFQSGTGAPNYFGLLATHAGPDALAFENKIFDGGHGAFTYFLLRGLNSDEARAAGDTYVRTARLSAYVADRVQFVTGFLQSPTRMTNSTLDAPVADLTKPGLKFDTTSLEKLRIPREELRKNKRRRESTSPGLFPQTESPKRDPQLARLIALEDQGEEILLRYLRGEEVPQEAKDFRLGQQLYESALALQVGSPYLRARAAFCQGRTMIFEKRYADAISALEQAIHLEPRAAYAYNALGIVYLEQSRYTLATAAFEDAIVRAPAWAYPRHNLALTQEQQGRYEDAMATYREAMRLAPHYFYLPYNLGLLYARLNRRPDAEGMYRAAIDLAPNRAEPYTALAQLESMQGRNRQARELFKRALGLPGQSALAMTATRHNYALLLARQPATLGQAIRYWTDNGDYLPSLFSLADALAKNGSTNQAIEKYRRLLELAPESTSARLALADQLVDGSDYSSAISVLSQGLTQGPRNPPLLERLGDAYEGAGLLREARDSYDSAMRYSMDPAMRRRIRQRLKALQIVRVR